MSDYNINGEGTIKNFVDKNTKENVKVWEEIDVEGRTFARTVWHKVIVNDSGNPIADADVTANPSSYIKRDNQYFKKAIASGSGTTLFTNDSSFTI